MILRTFPRNVSPKDKTACENQILGLKNGGMRPLCPSLASFGVLFKLACPFAGFSEFPLSHGLAIHIFIYAVFTYLLRYR